MKSIITIEQVNDNLKRLFPDKEITCTDIWTGNWNGETFFYFETNKCKCVAINKVVYIQPDLKTWLEYYNYCRDYNLVYVKQRVKDLNTVIPFYYKKRDKFIKKQNDLLLLAFGLKKEKTVLSDIDRLRKLGLTGYVQFYKIIQEVKVTCAYMENKKWQYLGDMKYELTKVLTVEHTKGKFSFPVDNIHEDGNDEVKAIFFNLLNLPLTNFTVTIKQRKAA